MKKIGDIIKIPSPKKQRGIHSELHEFVDETRKEWSDELPFGHWLGLLKNIPPTILYQIRGSIRDSNARTPAKLFFWQVKKWKKEHKSTRL